jgi:hypothetical protein
MIEVGRTVRYKSTWFFGYTVMSVRDNMSSVQDVSVTYGAAYMPCRDCGEGAIVWNEEKMVSECFRCGSVYEGEEPA